MAEDNANVSHGDEKFRGLEGGKTLTDHKGTLTISTLLTISTTFCVDDFFLDIINFRRGK